MEWRGHLGNDDGMTDFGGTEEFTSWDGEPVSREPPHGATVVVASHAPDGWRYVLLHRGHQGQDREGDWAWTPPAGTRKPGEDIAACAARELQEETGVQAAPQPVQTAGVYWAVFALELPWGTAIQVDGTEHDRFEWVSYAEAVGRIRPAVVVETFTLACQAAGFR